MREYHVLCGGLQLKGPRPLYCLELDTDAAAGADRTINLDLGDITRPMVAGVPDRYADLLQIAAYIYCADQFSRRDTEEMREFGADWRRTFHFRIPIRDAAFWKTSDVTKALCDAVKFLSDDDYHFQFTAARRLPPLSQYLNLHETGSPHGFRPDRIALFSGGLDSFAGAAEALLDRGEQLALVSHCSSTMVSGKQSVLVDALRQRTRPAQLFHIGVNVNKGPTEAAEFTQRSRSFLFAALGATVARMFDRQDVVFFENGVVSLNLPFAEHVLGARATRTTHPRVLAAFTNLFSLIAGIEVRFANPYFWMTKADIVRKIVALDAGDLIADTFSCTRTRDATITGQHCGACSQCIDRRFGIMAAGAHQYEGSDRYAVDLFTGARQAGPDLTLAESFVLTAFKFSSMTPAGFVGRYAQVFRVLNHLPGTAEDNLSKLFALHRRHGAEVSGVVDAESARHSSVAAITTLPATCLLSVIRTQSVSQPPLMDRTEREPPPAQQSEAPGSVTLNRPITLAFDEARDEVLFQGGAVLKGKSARLLRELYEQHREALDRNLPPDAYPYLLAESLSERLGIEQPALRQRILRTRKALARHFMATVGIEPAMDDVIQNQDWSGYRLNPYLSIRQRAFVEALNKDEPAECHELSPKRHNSTRKPTIISPFQR